MTIVTTNGYLLTCIIVSITVLDQYYSRLLLYNTCLELETRSVYLVLLVTTFDLSHGQRMLY